MFSLEPFTGDLKNRDGWVDPEGSFYACSYEDHWRFADEMCKKKKYRLMSRFLFNLDSEYTLEVNGWIKISLGRVHYHNEKPMTKKQIDLLFDYFVANGKEMKEFNRLMARRYTA